MTAATKQAGDNNPALDYERNIDLVHKITNKIMGRINYSGMAMTREDVFQELSLLWLVCAEKYDEGAGIAFSTYFVRSAFNNMNRELLREGNSPFYKQADGGENDEGEQIDLFEVLDLDGGLSPEEVAQHFDSLEAELAKLSDEARLILSWTIDPPQELIDEIEKKNQMSEQGQTRVGLSSAMAFAGALMSIPNAKLYQARGELMQLIKQMETK